MQIAVAGIVGTGFSCSGTPPRLQFFNPSQATYLPLSSPSNIRVHPRNLRFYPIPFV